VCALYYVIVGNSFEDPKFKVAEYSRDNFVALLQSTRVSDKTFIANKDHIDILTGYLKKIGAQMIVIEPDYIDHDYLQDYAEYFVKCFSSYKRRCIRLHFFDIYVEEDKFIQMLLGKDSALTKAVQEAYLGFMVVKPLPRTVIGKTCLKTYYEDSERFYPITRSYDASLYGLPLIVKESLAFQEQDRSVSACATSALWSVLHGTGKLFQHPILSPSEITRLATKYSIREERTFPNHGLIPIEMARAIREIGLEPEAVQVTDMYMLQGTAYAYLRAKIPFILGVTIRHQEHVNDEKIGGEHAVAVAGYHLGRDVKCNHDKDSIPLVASRIDKFYVHDDQYGPFVRMVISGKTVLFAKDMNSTQDAREVLDTAWLEGKGVAIPKLLLIPLYNKIRIHYRTAYKEICILHKIILTALKYYDGNVDLEWDIYLTTINQLKSELSVLSKVDDKVRLEVLMGRMPRYIWRAKGIINGDTFLDIFIDATGISQGSLFVNVLPYHHSAATYLLTCSNSIDKTEIKSSTILSVIEKLCEMGSEYK